MTSYPEVFRGRLIDSVFQGSVSRTIERDCMAADHWRLIEQKFEQSTTMIRS